MTVPDRFRIRSLDVSSAIRDAFVEDNPNWPEPRNVVDALTGIAAALDRVADALYSLRPKDEE